MAICYLTLLVLGLACEVISYLTLHCLALLIIGKSYLILPRLALPRLALPRLALPCLALPSLALITFTRLALPSLAWYMHNAQHQNDEIEKPLMIMESTLEAN